jgi:Flp pilus assembly pilin Flp
VSRAAIHIMRLIRDDKGATAIEYVVIASVLGLALIPVLANTSSGVASLYTRVLGYANIINGT